MQQELKKLMEAINLVSKLISESYAQPLKNFVQHKWISS